MEIGDLVVATGFVFHDHGIGIIIGTQFGSLKVFWPEKGVWCFTGTGGVKPLSK